MLDRFYLQAWAMCKVNALFAGGFMSSNSQIHECSDERNYLARRSMNSKIDPVNYLYVTTSVQHFLRSGYLQAVFAMDITLDCKAERVSINK